MKIKNKTFWENKDIVRTQDKIKKASIYEKYMFESAIDRLKDIGKIEVVNIYGCGTGRDIKVIDAFFKPNKIVASDISENMIKGCSENLKSWELNAEVEVHAENATNLNLPEKTFDLVTLLNGMLTYVALREDRLKIYSNAYNALKKDGVVIGTVHNQMGKPIKTLYFKLRGLLSFILKDKVGNRSTGFNGYKVLGYYYDKKWLKKDLNQVGFNDIEIYSLEEFFAKIGKEYDKSKGSNQLIFIASK